MLVNVDQNLKSLGGDILKDVDASGNAIDAVVKTCMVNSLLLPVDKETGMVKIQKYELAKKIFHGGEVELSVEDIALLKECVSRSYPPLIVGQVFEMLKV